MSGYLRLPCNVNVIFVTFCFLSVISQQWQKEYNYYLVNQSRLLTIFGQIDLCHHYGISETKTCLSWKFCQLWEAKSGGFICKLHLFNKRLGRLLNFWTLRVGAYSRWALIKISASVVCLFCYKTINGNNKLRRCNKARFLSNTQEKTLSSGKSLISTYSIFLGRGESEKGDGMRVGAYLSLSGRRRGWALIRGWH